MLVRRSATARVVHFSTSLSTETDVSLARRTSVDSYGMVAALEFQACVNAGDFDVIIDYHGDEKHSSDVAMHIVFS